MERARAHLIISGLVQGVWYRASARDEARKLGLAGWVKNSYDGNVEALAEGPKDLIEKFVAWCRKGPPYARVEDVKVDWQSPTGEFRDFRVVY